MADVADRANDLMQERIDQLLAARAPARGGVSALECTGCGGEIPEARRLAAPGCVRCIECQTLMDRRNARG